MFFFFTNSKIYVLILNHIYYINNIKTVCSLYKLLYRLCRILCTFILLEVVKFYVNVCAIQPYIYLIIIIKTRRK